MADTTDWKAEAERLRSARDAALAELEQARRDSVHYRWLIEQHWMQAEADWRMSLPDGDTLDDFARDLGVAIDAAIAARQEHVDAAMAAKGE